MNLLSKEQILSAMDHQIEEVEVPEWGGSVCVRSLTGRERDWWETEMHNAQESGKMRMENFRATIASMVICNEVGANLFTTNDVMALSEKSGAALDKVLEVLLRISGLSQEEQEGTPDFSEADQTNLGGSD